MDVHGSHIIALVVAVAFAGQWLAWRTRIPAILFLLLAGLAMGPLLQGPDLAAGVDRFARAFVPLAAALILFEGGLNTRVRDLRRIGRPLWGLVTIGLLVTWLLTSLAALYLTPLGPELSLLAGAILVVTGPTVIGPLLRHLHLRGPAGAVLQFEGTLNDPVGAVLAIITFQVVQLQTLDEALTVALLTVAKSVGVAFATGLAGAAAVVALLRRRLLPPYLRATGSSALVVVAFALSDLVQAEAGLLAVTIMGVALASQPFVAVAELRRSHEDLEVALVSILFIVLVARIPLASVLDVAPSIGAWFAALALVVRPAAVFAATWGSRLTWRERLWIAAVAPRGVVAAAVASVFALKIADGALAGHALFLPLNFGIVALSVAFYGLSAKPVARALGLVEPTPTGLAVLGINPFSLALARALRDAGPRVLLLDADRGRVRRAQREGFSAEAAALPSESELDRLELDDIGHFLATTSEPEVNALAALQFAPRVEDRAYQLIEPPDASGDIPEHLRGHALRPEGRTELVDRIVRGARIEAVPLGAETPLAELTRREPDAVPLFHLDPSGRLNPVYPVEPAARSGHGIVLRG